MQITCSCGKKLFFGEGPNETQVCDRCGQTVRATGPVAEKGPAGRRGSGLRGAASGEAPPFRPPRGRPPITEPEKLFIAGARRSMGAAGCVLVLLVALAGAFAVDFYLVYPRRDLRCGHRGKESYLFGAVPLGHTCKGLKAIRYMDRARKAFVATPNMPADMNAIRARAGIGLPPEGTPYLFGAFEGGTFTAVPGDAAEKLDSYTMAPDGTVTRTPAE